MRLVVAVVGKARNAALGEAIRDYETRAARYWPLDVHEVREERASGG
ncbi:MAG: 23S rRNA (pseudouridine(1915)-N(3))-methyltransferase RlmH [Actinobacteria bacterium]|nr:23S rRNA (pseudouridine(1915)-N(3))-methyltransferase RlmH [Actinomycetota bacterium]